MRISLRSVNALLVGGSSSTDDLSGHTSKLAGGRAHHLADSSHLFVSPDAASAIGADCRIATRRSRPVNGKSSERRNA
jgi:hypothetical protein